MLKDKTYCACGKFASVCTSCEDECEECHSDLSKNDHKMSCSIRSDVLLPSKELSNLLKEAHQELEGFSKQVKNQIEANRNLRIKLQNINSDNIVDDAPVPEKTTAMLEAEIKGLKDQIFCLTDDRDHWALFHQEMVALVLHQNFRARVNLEPGGGDGSRAMDQITAMHEKIQQLEIQPTFHQGWDSAIDQAAEVCQKVATKRNYDGGIAAIECAAEVRKFRSSKKEKS